MQISYEKVSNAHVRQLTVSLSFLRLGLPSRLIRHEHRAFQQRSSNRRNLITPPLRFTVDGKQFENGTFGKKGEITITRHVISPIEFSRKQFTKWPEITGFSNFSDGMWTGPEWIVF